MRDRLAVFLIAAAVAVPLSACAASSTAETGRPAAAPGSSRPALPPRPRDVDLAGVDTCTLLTPAQQRQISTDTPPEFTEHLDRYGNRRCDYGKRLASPRFGYQVKVVTQEDEAVYLTDERDAVARVVSAAGFPAVENHPPGDERGCFVDVSTNRASPHPDRACRGLLGWALSVNSTSATFPAPKMSLVSSSRTAAPTHQRTIAREPTQTSQLTRE